MATQFIEDADKVFAGIPLASAEAERATAKSWWIMSRLHQENASHWQARAQAAEKELDHLKAKIDFVRNKS